jgi:type I restriction enzyme M protein
MSSATSGEGEIRKNILKADLVECMVALPGQLFTNTQIPACIWFLTKNKKKAETKRARHGEVLFIDAREKGFMKDRVLRDFTDQDIDDIANTFHAWQKGESYNDIAGFCKSVTLEEIAKHDYVLSPSRYVGSTEADEEEAPFADKMTFLIDELKGNLEENDRLKQSIKEQLGSLGYEL